MPAHHPRTGLLLDTVYRDHDTGPGQPESPARIMAVVECLQKRGLADHSVPLKQQRRSLMTSCSATRAITLRR